MFMVFFVSTNGIGKGYIVCLFVTSGYLYCTQGRLYNLCIFEGLSSYDFIYSLKYFIIYCSTYIVIIN